MVDAHSDGLKYMQVNTVDILTLNLGGIPPYRLFCTFFRSRFPFAGTL